MKARLKIEVRPGISTKDNPERIWEVSVYGPIRRPGELLAHQVRIVCFEHAARTAMQAVEEGVRRAQSYYQQRKLAQKYRKKQKREIKKGKGQRRQQEIQNALNPNWRGYFQQVRKVKV